MLDSDGAAPGADAASHSAASLGTTPAAGTGHDAAGASSLAGVAAPPKTILADLIRLAKPATPTERGLLLALALIDLALVAAYLAYAYAEHHGLEQSVFHGNLKFSFVDGGYPEIYGYAKQALAALLLLGAHSARRQKVHRALALLFAVVLLDDSLTLHETLGAHLAGATGLSIRLTELSAWAAIGVVPLLAIGAGYRVSDATSRADARAVLAAFALLLFFAIGMDAVHGVLNRYVSGYQTVFTLAEDGGELVTLTLICAVALGVFRRAKGRG